MFLYVTYPLNTYVHIPIYMVTPKRHLFICFPTSSIVLNTCIIFRYLVFGYLLNEYSACVIYTYIHNNALTKSQHLHILRKLFKLKWCHTSNNKNILKTFKPIYVHQQKSRTKYCHTILGYAPELSPTTWFYFTSDYYHTKVSP